VLRCGSPWSAAGRASLEAAATRDDDAHSRSVATRKWDSDGSATDPVDRVAVIDGDRDARSQHPCARRTCRHRRTRHLTDGQSISAIETSMYIGKREVVVARPTWAGVATQRRHSRGRVAADVH
jgi:hypothetical protein